MDLGRVGKTLVFFPQGLFFLIADLLNLHDRRGIIDTLALADHRNEHFFHGIRPTGQGRLFPRLVWIKEFHILIGVKGFIVKTDQIGFDLATFLIIDTEEGLISRIGSDNLILGIKPP